MSVELFRITDADVLRAKDVWESQCGMVELIGPQMAMWRKRVQPPGRPALRSLFSLPLLIL
jgi:hypothetical protein